MAANCYEICSRLAVAPTSAFRKLVFAPHAPRGGTCSGCTLDALLAQDCIKCHINVFFFLQICQLVFYFVCDQIWLGNLCWHVKVQSHCSGFGNTQALRERYPLSEYMEQKLVSWLKLPTTLLWNLIMFKWYSDLHAVTFLILIG